VDGHWGRWTAWSACSKTCGDGTQTRTRVCDDPAPKNGGSACVGDSSQTQACKIATSPVDGHWGSWTAWSACSKTCGDGTQTRTRMCDDPAPKNGGSACVGDSSQTQACKIATCWIGEQSLKLRIPRRSR
ncbi:predicted protein, partial [Nematostella vectensis]